jgi:hypothetical protein
MCFADAYNFGYQYTVTQGHVVHLSQLLKCLMFFFFFLLIWLLES